MRRAALLAVLVPAACGPISPQLAADQCEKQVRATTIVTGEAGMGVGSASGIRNRTVTESNFEVEVSTSTYSNPHAAYEKCVRDKSGQGPVRPLDLER